jgi:TolB-like protein/DNA-binding winged helix-turn-helix (wHTH) protein
MLQFEGYTLDIARHSLRAADRKVALRPKNFELLRYLVENPDRLVTKEELLKAIWPDVVVTEDSLTRCVSEVRQAIGDSKQTIIVTVPRCGYRFTAPVVRARTSAAAAPPYSAPPAGGAIAYGAAGSSPSPQDGGGHSEGSTVSDDRPAVAVLPFVNLSGDPQQDYFSDGITEDITTELSRFSELMVIGRNSAFQYKGKAVDLRQIGRELSARYLLEGSVRRSGDRIRITAQLIDAVTGVHRWAERYDRELHDVFAVQDEVVRAIVTTLPAHVNRAEIERALLKPPAAWEAYEYYLRGAEAFFSHLTRRTEGALYEARRLLEQALAIDPDYARAAAMLSQTHLRAYYVLFDGDYLSPAALDRALELAQTAVRLDPLLPQARAQLGQLLLFKRRHDAALAEFERAFALNPNFIDYRYAQALMSAGEPARAIEVLELNIRLDPFQPFQFFLMGVAHYMLKR